MLAATNLHKNFYKLVGIAESEGITVTFSYHEKIYLLTIQPTGEKFTKKSRRMAYQNARRKRAVDIELTPCKTCGSSVAGGICLNRHCETNITVMPSKS